MKQKQFPAHTLNNLRVDPEKQIYIERVHRECHKYGIITGVFSNTCSLYTDYEREALKYIEQGKEIPDNLKEKLIATLPERLERNKRYTNNDFEMTEEEAEEILGIKL